MEKPPAPFKILAPKLSQGLAKIELTPNDIGDEFTLSSGIIGDCSVENQRAEHTVIKEIIFRNVVLDNVLLKELK